MAKKSITNQSIFGHYKSEENMVTAALLHILKLGGEELINFILDARTQTLPSSEIAVLSQVKGNGSVPDALLTANYSFKLIIESKITTGQLNQAQYQSHLSQCTSPTDRLIYITPHKTRPAMLDNKVLWYGWREMINLLEEYSPLGNNPILEFLINQFHILLENLNVCDFITDRVIVVGGNWGEDIALKYGLYICQNHRFNLDAKYIAFACKNRIKYVFEIIGMPQNDVDLSQDPQIAATDYLTACEPNYVNTDLRQVFQLKLLRELKPAIVNDTVDKNGRRCAFIRRQTYTTLEKLTSARHTSDLR